MIRQEQVDQFHEMLLAARLNLPPLGAWIFYNALALEDGSTGDVGGHITDKSSPGRLDPLLENEHDIMH